LITSPTLIRSQANRRSLSTSAGALVFVLPACVVLGIAATSRTGAIACGVLVLGGAALLGIRRRWGIAVCLAPVFLLPVSVMTTLPAVGVLKWRFILAVVTASLATAYWRQGGGRPRLNQWSLAAAGLLFVALLALGAKTHTSVQESLSVPLFAYSGLVIGQCLRDARVVRPIAYLAVPLAVLAILEALGLESIWTTVFHANAHAAIADEANATRSTSSFGHPLIAGACLVATGLILLSVRDRLATIAGLICIVAAATTVSRSALLAGALGIFLFALQSQGRHRVRTIATAAFLVAAVAVAVYSIPALRKSFESRVSGVNESQLLRKESVRENSLVIVKEEFDDAPTRLLLGGGVGYSTRLLIARGGNAAGYDIFDNEYITMLYDGGLVIALGIFALLAMASAVASRDARRNALPAVAAIMVVMYFVDGMEWASLGLVAWMTIGMFTALRPSPGPSTSPARKGVLPGRPYLRTVAERPIVATSTTAPPV
jgi:hypothetical protein